MPIPKELMPRPYKLKKGETIGSVLKKRGFDKSAAKKVFEAKYNKSLNSVYDSHADVPPGKIVRIPVLSKRDLETLIDGCMKIGFEASRVLKADQLQQTIYDIEDSMGSLEAAVSAAKAKLGPELTELRTMAEHCEKVLKNKNLGIGQMSQCKIEIAIWRTRRNEASTKALSALKTAEAALAKARAQLNAARKAHSVTNGASKVVEKLAGDIAKSSRSLLPDAL